ncbi:MAG: ABC transporter permease [Chloroflexi bacterium]|nr:ABC transporter permease [Chloroflexota bacterium]MBV6435154.1 Oligopeptide transport system permease protein OppC [Anaerolineae bacterium]MDL1917102.1 ABC transporter permease [Anaerolineae bacterium CFX4]MCC6565343.1 ABC transporter permease [Chloroflexota bacterium]MCO6443403.1 ABC transporter permease [Anaerolineae bacterium]
MTDATRTPSSAAPGVTQLDVHDRPQKNRALRRFMRHRLAILAVIVLAVIAATSILAPVFAPYPYDKIDLAATAQPPSVAHLFGTDRVGRDILTRTLYGGQVSLLVGMGATAIATLIGTVIGALSGYYRGWVDTVLMRITDTVMTFPSIVIMLTLAALLPRSVWNIVLIIGLLSWPGVARLVRAQFMSLRESEFVMAARCLGVPDRRIIVVHIFPNVLAPMIALITFSVGGAILTEAGLSFLGLGVAPPTPSWGNMLEAARNLDILKNLTWTWFPPAAMTVLTVLCVNFVGDGIRDAIDPRLVL